MPLGDRPFQAPARRRSPRGVPHQIENHVVDRTGLDVELDGVVFTHNIREPIPGGDR